MAYTPPSDPFIDNASPVGGGAGQSLNAAFFTSLVAGVKNADNRLTTLEAAPSGGTVSSVNGKPGPTVVLNKADVGLGNVDNTSDATKLAGKVGSTTIATIVTLTQAAYDALTTPDPATLYIVTG